MAGTFLLVLDVSPSPCQVCGLQRKPAEVLFVECRPCEVRSRRHASARGGRRQHLWPSLIYLREQALNRQRESRCASHSFQIQYLFDWFKKIQQSNSVLIPNPFEISPTQHVPYLADLSLCFRLPGTIFRKQLSFNKIFMRNTYSHSQRKEKKTKQTRKNNEIKKKQTLN